MKRVIYNFLVLILCTLCFAQCRQKEENSKVTVEKFNRDSIVGHDLTIRKADSLAKIAASGKTDTSQDQNITSIKFDREVYDFGECTEGDKVKKTIEFTNTGKIPLVITQAYGSCGCTVPTYDKSPVQPGKKGKIEVQFDSSHKPGSNTKSVNIIANTYPELTSVSFSVKVKAAKKKGWF